MQTEAQDAQLIAEEGHKKPLPMFVHHHKHETHPDPAYKFYRRSKEQYLEDILKREEIRRARIFRARAVGGHKPKESQLDTYNRVESIDYLPPDHAHASAILKARTLKEERKRGAFMWLMYFVVGSTTSFALFILLKIIKTIEYKKTDVTESLLEKGNLGLAWLFWSGFCVLFAFVAALCVLEQPAAAASGIPGLLAFLNGASPPPTKNACGRLTGFLTTSALCIKWLGTLFSIPSGLAIGPEGPIIHIGAMLGKHVVRGVYALERKVGYAQHTPLQSGEKRDFLATGAGCGISAAFHAPIAGVMFVVEEASSFVTVNHIEKTFFASVMAYWVVWGIEQFTSSNDSFVKFDSPSGVYCSLYTLSDFVLFILMGVCGGVLGSVFNFIVEKLSEFRREYINAYPRRRVAEVLAVALLTGSVAVLLPLVVPCRPLNAAVFIKDSMGCMDPQYRHQLVDGTLSESFLYQRYGGDAFMALYRANRSAVANDPRSRVVPFLDPKSSAPAFVARDVTRHTVVTMKSASRHMCKKGEYNEMAMLFLKPGVTAVTNMFLRGAPHLYSPWTLLLFLMFYFFLAAITSGISVPAGLVVPMMLMGGAFGRLVGLLNLRVKANTCTGLAALGRDVDILTWAHQSVYKMKDCGWPDPGSYALVGAGAIMGGTGRITIFLAVVLLEITNDIKMMPPIAFAVVIAMWVGNSINHGLYHALIPVQSIPYLNNKPDFEMHTAHTVELMSSPLTFLPRSLSAADLKEFLEDPGNIHNGFPVVDERHVLVGIVTRHHLLSLLPEWWHADRGDRMVAMIDYMDRSPITVYPHTPVARTFAIFRSMGMRHLVVVERNGMAVGMITRKDLQRWRLHELNTESPHPLFSHSEGRHHHHHGGSRHHRSRDSDGSDSDERRSSHRRHHHGHRRHNSDGSGSDGSDGSDGEYRRSGHRRRHHQGSSRGDSAGGGGEAAAAKVVANPISAAAADGSRQQAQQAQQAGGGAVPARTITPESSDDVTARLLPPPKQRQVATRSASAEGNRSGGGGRGGEGGVVGGRGASASSRSATTTSSKQQTRRQQRGASKRKKGGRKSRAPPATASGATASGATAAASGADAVNFAPPSRTVAEAAL